MARSFRIFEGLNQERIEAGASVFKPLASNADAQDGFNPSAVMFDELHAQASREQWDVLESGFGARKQPLLSAITTAGFILDGICTEIRDRAGRPVKFDTVVCFCQGKLTAGTETAWHWWIYVPSHFTHAFK